MTLPFSLAVAAARSAGSRAGVLPVLLLAKLLGSTAPSDGPTAALQLARVAAGSNVDTLTAREIELEIAALSESQRSLALVVAPVLAQPDTAAVAQRAFAGIVAAMSAALGAWVPIAIAVDATVLQACRECGWGSEQLGEKDRSKELARRLARALGVPVIEGKGVEDADTSARKLAALDLEVAAADARKRAIEGAIRAGLPRV